MAILLPPRGNTEHRLLCSECRKRNGDKDEGLRCFFQEYTRPPDPEKVAEFELRDRGDDGVEWREDVASSQWSPYAGAEVFCLGCLAHSEGSNYVIFDPRTREEVAA